MDDLDLTLDPSLNHIFDKDSTLKWIFVGGKGGVGKTTSSCSTAIQLALLNPDKQYLLISTDPAHNLSDAFGQKFDKDARKVEGLNNLSCMEIDPNSFIEDMKNSNDLQSASNDPSNVFSGLSSIMNDMSSSIPGIDEALSFMEVMKHIQRQDQDKNDKTGKKIDYNTIIFDTAPTGHTLRFLQLPSTLEKLLGKVSDLSDKFGPLINNFIGSNNLNQNNQQDIFKKLKDIQSTVTEINKQFVDPDLTTFICVCISEFLSLYETERLVQELASYNMDVNSIIVNQLLFSDDSSCKRCLSRWKMQKKYLNEMYDLYEDFHLIKMPLLGNEIRGLQNLKKFSQFLIKPYDPKEDEHIIFELENND